MRLTWRRTVAYALAALVPLACGGDEPRRPTAADLVPDLDARLLDVERVALAAGLPDSPPTLAAETQSALDGLAERLERNGFGPLMRRGARPRPRVEVALRVEPQQVSSALERARAADADLVFFLSLDRLEVRSYEPPANSKPGRVDSVAAGVVRVVRLRGAPLDARTSFESRTRALLSTKDIAQGASPREVVARRLGRGLLDTLRLGASWTRPPARRDR